MKQANISKSPVNVLKSATAGERGSGNKNEI